MVAQPDSDEVIEFVATNLRRIRLELGLTQAMVANGAELDLTYIQRMERGRQNMTERVLARVAATLEVPVIALLEPCKPQQRPSHGRPKAVPKRVGSGSSS